ncbi:MAG: transglutaminase family protein [Gemmataceae bacterium]
MHTLRFLLLGVIVFLVPQTACSDDKEAEPRSVAKLAEAARQSLVVITFNDRDDKKQGLGTGFVVSEDGLIATNLHVIGEARPIQVELADGKRHNVVSVHASDRHLDLALIKIDVKGLKPLPLGDSDKLKQGQPIVALGNPHGLKYSVVSGVVSGHREVDGRNMIQVAIPIEPGNSGGPLIDLEGRVQGIVTMKDLVTRNLGFAMPVNLLKNLIKKPNPVPMKRWLTIGTLDPAEWQIVPESKVTEGIDGGAIQWRQRAGHVSVSGLGAGFGGRGLCLAKEKVPEVPYEAAVYVKLDNEGGAAGLAFQSDGGDKHFGFYPSSGKLRLTHFEGPNVFAWKILRNEASPHYREGDWNHLKVRVEKDRLVCYVNGELCFEQKDLKLGGGLAGLAKFRDTKAEFKGFRVAKELPALTPPPEVIARVNKSVADLDPKKPLEAQLVDKLLPDAPASVDALRDRARLLEQQAARLRDLAQAVHRQRVSGQLQKLFARKEDEIDLCHAALLIAWLDNDELDVEHYLKEIERMARDIRAGLPRDADEQAKRAALDKYLFAERGFHGSRTDYYNRSNSYLNEVLDDREGLPITLSVLYMELGRRLGLKIVGVPLPGHFVVRHEPSKGPGQLIDVYEGAKSLSRADADKKVKDITGEGLTDEHLKAATKKAIATRMLHNLMSLARTDRDVPGMLRYEEATLAITPDSGEDRIMRALLRFQSGDKPGARADVDWILKNKPEGIDLDKVEELRQYIERE